MWFTLILLSLLLGITIRQASQGLFGALVTMALTCCAAALALGTYEWVAIHWVAPNWRPDYALPVALGVTFGLSLVLSRLAFDFLVRRSCLLPAWVDRVGGGVCGFITSLTTVGIFAICMQMLPFDKGVILGYQRLPSSTSKDRRVGLPTEQSELLLSPDRFALNIASMLSSGVFGSGKDPHKDGPDLLENIAWVGSVHPEVSRFAPPNSIAVLGAKPVESVFKLTPGNERRGTVTKLEAQPPVSGHKFHAVRIKLRNPARDKYKSHIFSLRQFRVVGLRSGSSEQYHPAAIRFEQGAKENGYHIASIISGSLVTPVTEKIYQPVDQKAEVEIVFETPSDFKPIFLEYKREARATLAFDDLGVFAGEASATPAPTARQAGSTGETGLPGERLAAVPAPAAGATPTAPARTSGRRSRRGSRRSGATSTQPAPRRGGNIRGITSTPGASRFGEELPMTLTSYQRLKNADLKRGAIVAGHLVGNVGDQADGKDRPISKFSVPEDKRLLQLSTIKLQARSGIGRIFTQVISTVQNYYVEDDRGRQYKIVGKYAIANVNGQQVFEVQYFSELAGAMGGLGKFSRIQEKNLGPQDTFALLFLVDPGARITAFSTGGDATRRDDLTSENLVAPD